MRKILGKQNAKNLRNNKCEKFGKTKCENFAKKIRERKFFFAQKIVAAKKTYCYLEQLTRKVFSLNANENFPVVSQKCLFA